MKTRSYKHTDSPQKCTYSQKEQKQQQQSAGLHKRKQEPVEILYHSLFLMWCVNLITKETTDISIKTTKQTTHHKSWHFWAFVQASVKIQVQVHLHLHAITAESI